MKTTRTKPEDLTIKVTLTIPASLVQRLDAHAEAERRTRSNAAALLLERALPLPPRQAG